MFSQTFENLCHDASNLGMLLLQIKLEKNNAICKFGTFQEGKNINIKPRDNDIINISQCASIPEYKGLADPVIISAVLLTALIVGNDG